jgi:putative tryptophan/tyrosine transport system substrate-binding protein
MLRAIAGAARWSVWSACLFGLALGMATEVLGQTTAKVYRIGWLGDGNPPSGKAGIADFEVGLRDRGYVDRRNILIEYWFAQGDPARLARFAEELVRLNVNVIVTAGEQAALAAQKAASTIPVVTTEFGFDPVKAGLVASLAKPGSNVTGLASISEELWEKRLATLKSLVPRLARIAVLWNPANPGNAACRGEIQRAAKTLGLQDLPLEVRDRDALERALAGIGRDATDALAIC